MRPGPTRRRPTTSRVASRSTSWRRCARKTPTPTSSCPDCCASAVSSGRDAALATELAYGALRGQGLYDTVLQACVDRPLVRVDPPVLDVLRLGTHQLLRTRIPPHAAVSATVDLARRVVSAGPVAFVNAVLRKVAAKDLPAWVAELAPADDRLAALALEHSHPVWIARAFRDALGGDLWQTGAALAADDARPEVHLVARRLPREELVSASGGTPVRGRRTPSVWPRATPVRSTPSGTAGPGCRTRAAS